MGKYPVTQGQYEAVMGINRSSNKHSQSENHPVERVSWDDAQEFINRLNGSSPRHRLPTEAEWEYACRAGTETEYFFGEDSDELGRYAWYSGNSNGKTHPVGQMESNPWGLYDMHGNVWEWVSDWYGSYENATVTDPSGPATGSARVFRGGGWGSAAEGLRSAYRRSASPGNRIILLGFRLVRTIP